MPHRSTDARALTTFPGPTPKRSFRQGAGSSTSPRRARRQRPASRRVPSQRSVASQTGVGTPRSCRYAIRRPPGRQRTGCPPRRGRESRRASESLIVNNLMDKIDTTAGSEAMALADVSTASGASGSGAAQPRAAGGPMLVVSAHAGDFVWRAAGAIALATARGQRHLWQYYSDLARRRGNHMRRNSGPNLGLPSDAVAEAYMRPFPQVTEI